MSRQGSREIATTLTGKQPAERQAVFSSFTDSENRLIDKGIVLYFASPASYTGEDVIELQAHGGMAVLQLLLQAVLKSGARQARPGEFTERAFINDKMDLLQAEAVADLIESSSEQAARSALRSLQGKFSEDVNRVAA